MSSSQPYVIAPEPLQTVIAAVRKDPMLNDINPMLDDGELLPALIASVKVTTPQLNAQLYVSEVQVSWKKHMIRAQELA